MREEAEQLRSEGASVFPIGANKRPRVPSWRAYQERHPTSDEMGSWWCSPIDAGIAIVCGHVSNTVVLDVEGDALDVLDAVEVPDTAIAQTQRGGIHIYFAHQPDVTTRVIAIGGRHIGELRSDGSYVAAPPTVGAHGPYVWLVRRRLDALPPPPRWVLDMPGHRGPASRPVLHTHTAVSHRPLGRRWPSRSEEDLAVALDLANSGMDRVTVESAMRVRDAAVDRGARRDAYVAVTVERARALSQRLMREAVVSGVALRENAVVITMEILGVGGTQRQLRFDLPTTDRSRQRWESLAAAAYADPQDPATLRGARLRVEWLPGERGHRVGRFYRAVASQLAGRR